MKAADRINGAQRITKSKARPDEGFDFKAFLKLADRRYVDAFRDLIKEHGVRRVVVFGVTDAEMATLELAAQLHGDGNVHHYAKQCAVSLSAQETSDFAAKVRNGSARLPRRKAGAK